LSLYWCFASDWLTEGITTLFVLYHIPSHRAIVKCSGSRFHFCANAAIYLWFLDRIGFNHTVGKSPIDFLMNPVTMSVYTNNYYKYTPKELLHLKHDKHFCLTVVFKNETLVLLYTLLLFNGSQTNILVNRSSSGVLPPQKNPLVWKHPSMAHLHDDR
jgi:hypothetical protein